MTGRILLTVVGLFIAVAQLPAPAAEPTDREKLLQAFDLLKKDYEKKGGLPAFGEKPGFVKIPERDTPIGKLKSIVKVAARKYDPKTEKAGDYVSLTSYRWKPDEYFVLCFQTANPVTFSLFNVTKAVDGKPKYEWLLPSDKMPESTAPIKPGKVYEFTKPLQMESHADNEAIQFVFSDASTKGGKKPLIATDKVSRQHVFQFSGTGKQQFVRRSQVREALMAKNARLTVLFSDSCSNEEAIFNQPKPSVAVFSYMRLSADMKVVGKIPGFRQAGAKQVRPCFQKLFLESQGLVDINGSFENSFAWFHPKEGGVFTRSLHESLRIAQNSESAGWADFYSGLRGQTQKEYQNWRGEALAKYWPSLNSLGPGERKTLEALKMQEEQAPQVFYLAGTRLKLVTEIKRGAVTVTDLPLDSPARTAGLRIGDIVVAVNGQRVTTIEDYYDVVGPEMAKELPVLTFAIRRGETAKNVTVRVPSR